MLRLTSRRRTVLVETLRELANLAVGALVLGQFVSNRAGSIDVVVLGVALWVGFLTLALWLSGDGEDR